MTKTQKTVLKAILITTLILILIAALIFGIIMWLFSEATVPREMYIYYNEMQTVMQDNIVYISEEFCENNQLSVVGIRQGLVMGEPFGEIIGEAQICYNDNPAKKDFGYSDIAKNLRYLSYSFSSKEDSNLIPVEISVNVYTKEKKDINYEYEYEGFEYSKNEISVSEIAYTIKAIPKEKAICRLNMRISIKKDVENQYTEEQKKERIEQVFKSAVDHIELFRE